MNSLLGAHESISGGLHLAFARMSQVGGNCLQIFTRNQRQWHSKPLSSEEISLFSQAWMESGKIPVASHASYLINLGKEQAEKSVKSFAEELHRCHLLSIPMVVIHPGSHGGIGVEAGLENVVKNLDATIEMAGAEAEDVMILIETTAGQGTGLGSRFEEVSSILTSSRYPDRLGVCVDTCHIFAAGYDIRTHAAYDKTFALFDEVVGLDKIKFFHLNDSKKELSSKVDRHEHIGQGLIGLEAFRCLLNDERFSAIAKVIETPKGKELVEDKENLALLKSLV